MKRLRRVLVVLGVVFGVAAGFGLWRKFRTRQGASFAMFGEVYTKERSEDLTKADATAVFGGVTLDLRDSEIATEATVDAFALFGGIEVLIPKRWRLSLSGTPIFGGIVDETDPDETRPADAPLLNVDATAIFGGVVVTDNPSKANRARARVDARGGRRRGSPTS